MYPEHITKPCEEQLTTAGFKALKTPEEVTEVLSSTEGTTLLVFNSVCGCAAREFTFPFPPSSPSIGLFKDGKLVHFIERHMIEGRPAKMIADNLVAAYEEYC